MVRGVARVARVARVRRRSLGLSLITELWFRDAGAAPDYSDSGWREAMREAAEAGAGERAQGVIPAAALSPIAEWAAGEGLTFVDAEGCCAAGKAVFSSKCSR